MEGDGDAHTVEAEAKAAEAETKSVEAGREENLTSNHDLVLVMTLPLLASFDPFFP